MKIVGILLLLFGLGVHAAVPLDDAQYQDIPEYVVRMVDPAVVAIQHERGAGSGFIVTEDGFILTNGHVVRGNDNDDPTEPARSITVILNDDRKFVARVLGFSMDPDVALLKIESPTPLATVQFGDSRNAQVGQRVFAVGTPHGFKRTFSSGILSNVDRADLNTFTKVIQTDAAINPGSSGGPLFDRNGLVLGMNTYGTRGANNIGFTIPIHVVERMYHDFRDHGRFMHADVPLFLIRELYDELRAVLGVESGILVEYVMSGSPADEAGLQPGDIIIAQNGADVSARNSVELLEFQWALASLKVGDPIVWEVLRETDNGYTSVELEAVLEEAEPAIAAGVTPGEIRVEKYDALGLPFTRIVRQHRIQYHLQDDPGVLVRAPDNTSPASRAQLERNDIITSVGGVAVHDVASFRDALESRLLARDPFIELEVRRRQLTWRTALAPYYDLAGKQILVIVPPGRMRYLDLILRELIAQGASLTVASASGEIALPSRVMQEQVALKDATVEDIDVLLLLDSDEVEQHWEDDLVLDLVRKMHAKERIVAALGASVITLLAAEPELLEKRITTNTGNSGEAIQRNARYTGGDVEKDAHVLTGSGADRQAVRDFLRELARSAR